MTTSGIGDEYAKMFAEIWNSSYSVDDFLEKFPRKLARQSALTTASLLRKSGMDLKVMIRGNKSPDGENPRNTKDGRTTGHRLGWVSDAMYNRLEAYATRYGYKGVNDALVVLLDMGLTEDEEGIDYQPPPITSLFAVNPE